MEMKESIGFENKVCTFDAITFMNEDQYDEEIKETNPDEMLPHDEVRFFPKKVIYNYLKKDNRRIHFRERSGVLLPYIKMKILDINCRPHKDFPISDIVVAPSSQRDMLRTV